MFKRFIRSKEGATAIEYGLIACGIAIAIAVLVFEFGSEIANVLYQNIADKLDGAGGG